VPPHEKELSLPPRGPSAAGQHRLAAQALKRHRMGERSFSPTALENFSSCPYRFLLQAIHRLQPREESEALEFVDPLTRGALFHEVQFRLLTRLRDSGKLPLDPRHLEEPIAWLEDTVDAVAAEYRERLAPAIPRVWDDGIAVIRADLREWLRRAADADDGWVPHRFELSFGLGGPDSGGRKARTTADADSVAEPVTILGRAKLRGSIDLVERRADGALRVTDHKTGKARTPPGVVINGGQALQPALYALVAEAHIGARVESGRLYYCTADGDFTERVIPLDETSREYAGRAIDLVADAIDEGFLPAAPREGACLWCDYRPVCGPREEQRAKRKPEDRIADLTALRNLP
jgi:ATP-dependent helicase/nuclease subunit B